MSTQHRSDDVMYCFADMGRVKRALIIMFVQNIKSKFMQTPYNITQGESLFLCAIVRYRFHNINYVCIVFLQWP